jgi:hypothetical protein
MLNGICCFLKLAGVGKQCMLPLRTNKPEVMALLCLLPGLQSSPTFYFLFKKGNKPSGVVGDRWQRFLLFIGRKLLRLSKIRHNVVRIPQIPVGIINKTVLIY